MESLAISRTYSELYGILNLLGNSYINKLPSKLYQLIISQKEDSYNPRYNSIQDLKNSNLSEHTLPMLMLFHINYWCEDENDKKQIQYILKKNEEEIKEKYDIENMFKKREEYHPKEEQQSETQILEYKENFFDKIKKIIKNIFKH